MTLHPLTHIFVTVELAVLTVTLPPVYGLAALGAGLCCALLIPSRTGVRLAGAFLRLLGLAALFLFLIHAVRIKPPGIDPEGIRAALVSFVRIAAPFVAILHLSRRVTAEELYALLVDIRVPPVIILILFRTLWLVPRLMERMDEVITAQKLRGMRIESTLERARAVLPTFSPIFTSMIDEISENSIVITSRGFLDPGRKSHLAILRFRLTDALIVTASTLLVGVLWF